MRRGLSILLVVFFGFGPLSLVLLSSDDASLPACCRRHGSHHCAMTPDLLRLASKTPAFTSPTHCPLFPVHGNAVPTSLATSVHHPFFAIRSAEPVRVRAINEARVDNIYLCTPALRGPPSLQYAYGNS